MSPRPTPFDSPSVKAGSRLSVVNEVRRRAEPLSAKAGSVERVLKERGEVARGIADGATKRRLREAAKPNSLTKTMRKAGVGLILAPDPITSVAGAVVLGASVAAKKRDPLSTASVLEELRKVMGEFHSSPY